MTSFNRFGREHVKPLALAMLVALGVAGAPGAFAGNANLGSLQSGHNFDQFIVKYRPGSAQRKNPANVDASLQRATRALSTTMAGTAAKGAPKRASASARQLRRMAIGADVVQMSRKLDRAEASAFMRQLAADPNVEYVEVDVRMRALATPNDTYYSQQWHYFDNVAGINLPTAWDKTTGSGVTVAVIDTGIAAHSDMTANLVGGYDFISDSWVARDGNGRDSNPKDEGDWSPVDGDCGAGSYASNSSWHGTHVTGTIAAVTNNSKGVAGIAYGAKVQPLRVLGRCGGSLSDIADAIIWASGGSVPGLPANPTPAKVINMSLGGQSSCPQTYQNAINTAISRGVTIVVAAGNSNNDASYETPANCPGVITVGAVNKSGARSIYGGGQASSFGNVVDIAAPGSDVLSLGNTGTTTQSTETYVFKPGTSMATPHVAGVVALMQSVRGSSPLTPSQVESIIKNTAKPFPTTPNVSLGAGIVNAAAAVTAAQGGGGGTNQPPVAGFTSSVNSLTATFTDTSTDSDGTIASRSWDFGDGTGSTTTNPSHTYATAGTYTVKLTVTDNNGASNTRSASVTVGASTNCNGPALCSGVAVALPSVSTAYWSPLYSITVPAGKTRLEISISGGTGDADLYVNYGSSPNLGTYTCSPQIDGNTEGCVYLNPRAGTYYVAARAYSAYSGVSLKATISP